MASTSIPDLTFSKLNFTGGFPSSVDLAPSIIFFILYALSVPVLAWRVVSPETRDRALIRPGIFVLVRLGTLGLRAVMSKNPYSIGELIAELVLVSIGYLFLISTIATLWNRNVNSHLPLPHPTWVHRLSRLTQLVIIASIATAIAGGSSISSAFEDPTKLNAVVGLRHATVILSLIAIALVTLGNIITQVEFALPQRETMYLYVPCAALIIVSVYRVCQNFISNPSSPAQHRATFWVLEMLFEVVAYVSILAISIPEWYPNTDKEDGKRFKRGRNKHNEEEVTGTEAGTDMRPPRYQ